MSKTDYAGINYAGFSMTNMDKETGIHFGVIHQREILQAWADDSEGVYADPQCPECSGEVVEYDEDKHGGYEDSDRMKTWGGCADYACESCKTIHDNSEVVPEDPDCYKYEADGYRCFQGYDDPDVFIELSPYFTYAQYCSPCAPGAGYVMNWTDPGVGVKTYVFGHDWFPEVMTGNMINCPRCNGTGLIKKADIPNYSEDRFKDMLFDDNRVKCWNCLPGWDHGELGKVNEYIQKAPYPVYSVKTGELVEV